MSDRGQASRTRDADGAERRRPEARRVAMGTTLTSVLSRFIEDAKRYPMLTPEREQELAIAWRGRGDRAALEALVGSHLRLVIKIARGFMGYGLPLADLVGEGNVGLLQAAEKFDPERGLRFSTYAMWWIRAAMQEYILHSWSLVKIGTTPAQKKLFFNLRRLKARLDAFEQGDLPPETVDAIAVELCVPEREVIEMNRRLSGGDNSLNAPLGSGGDGEWLELLPDERPSQEAIIVDLQEGRRQRSLLGAALKTLNPREREILAERHLTDAPASLQELSHRYAVSRERIRQIELQAVGKLRRAVANDLARSLA
jgi:RNA polymerase sigma-32 factor